MPSKNESLERLIVVYHVSDGCMYSCEVTVPVLFEDKDMFELTLEELALDQAKKISAFNVEAAELSSTWMQEARRVSSLSSSKKSKHNDLTRLQEIEEQQRLLREQEPSATITLGGQTFDVSVLVEGLTYHKPAVYTVDEWFEQGIAQTNE